jgi:hypothetical protein
MREIQILPTGGEQQAKALNAEGRVRIAYDDCYLVNADPIEIRHGRCVGFAVDQQGYDCLVFRTKERDGRQINRAIQIRNLISVTTIDKGTTPTANNRRSN